MLALWMGRGFDARSSEISEGTPPKCLRADLSGAFFFQFFNFSFGNFKRVHISFPQVLHFKMCPL